MKQVVPFKDGLANVHMYSNYANMGLFNVQCLERNCYKKTLFVMRLVQYRHTRTYVGKLVCYYIQKCLAKS